MATTLVLSFDIGTTFAAAAYALVRNGESIEIGKYTTDNLQSITFEGNDYGLHQVRVQLACSEAKESFLWGHEVDMAIEQGDITESDRIDLLKLALDYRNETIQERQKIQTQLDRLANGRGALSGTVLISVFLKCLYDYTLKKIEGAIIEENFSKLRIESILCVPAIWDLKQRTEMIEAAKKAGMSRPKLIFEPEAAAIFCMHETLKIATAPYSNTASEVQTPMGILTLDAGGGTVDLIIYIAQGTTLREGAAGTGGLCGSEFLNSRFRRFIEHFADDEIKELLGGVTQCDRDSTERRIVDKAVANFEYQKRTFSGEDMMVRIPSSPENYRKGKHDNYIKIPSRDIRGIFNQVLKDIVRLAKQQINAFNENNAVDGIVISYILFVGGFSGNPYAKDTLKAKFEGIKVRTPHEDSSTLISRGALLRSLNQDSIGEYYLRCSYGVAMDEDYDPSVHKERYNKKVHGKRKIYQDYRGGHPIVQKRIHWLFKAGCKVKAEQTGSARGWLGFPLRGEVHIAETLYRSERQTKDSLPVRDPRNKIKPVAVLRITLPEAEDWGYVATNEETGDIHRRSEYEVLNTFYNPSSKFEMILPKGGRFPDEVGWGGVYYRKKCRIDVAAAVHGTPAPARARAKPRATSRQKVVAQPSRRSWRLTHSRLCLTAGGGQRLNESGSSGLP